MKETYKKIIKEFETRNIEFVDRNVNIPLDSGKVVTVVGPRRSGKTYTLYQLIESIPKEQGYIYINFEDERIDYNQGLDPIFDAYFELYPDQKKENLYIFFDEIQEVPRWPKFVRRVYDTISKKIFITGSNQKILATDIAQCLRGRTLTYEILPLSFSEFMDFKGVEADKYTYKGGAKLRRLIEEYIKYGFYPEIALESNKNIRVKILQEYFNTLIYRDVIERYDIQDVYLVKFIMKRVYSSLAKEFSINKVYNDLKSAGFKTGKDKIYSLIEHLEDVYFLYPLRKYARSAKKRMLLNKKVYTFDNGIVNAVTADFSADRGKYFENMIFNELYKKSKEIYYLSNDYECDFMVNTGNSKIAVQAVVELKESNYGREIKGLKKGMDKLKAEIGYIVFLDNRTEQESSDNKKLVDFFDFLSVLKG